MILVNKCSACFVRFSSGFMLVVLIGLVFANSTSATSASTTASVKVAAACTMSTSGGGSYSATVPNGTTSEISGSTFTVTCNDANGFALYAVGNSNNTVGNTNLVGTSTNIATNTSGNDSYWAMKVNPTSGNTPTIENSFNNYHVIPNTHTKVASYSSSTGSGSLSVQATYKASISTTQLAGNYLGQVKYTLIHPSNGPEPVTPLLATDCPANKICYAPNADYIIGSMDSISSSKITTSPTAGVQSTFSNTTSSLIAPNYSRDGYGFAGWSKDYEPDSSSIIYGPNEVITTSTSGTGDADVSINGLILYPVWIESTGTIQSWTGCSSLTIAPTATRATLSSMTALTDQRDGNTYTVARLADGKCWMTENLRLDAEYTLGSVNQALAQGYGDDTANNRGKFIGLANSENDNFSSTVPDAANNATNSIYSSDGSTGINIGTTNSPAYRIPRYNNNNTNRSLTSSYDDNTIYYQWYGYGNYYNWSAAVANTTLVNTNNQSVTTTSLCPTGWRLPIGGDKSNEANNDFWTLIVTNLNGGTNPANYDSQTRPYYTGITEADFIGKAVLKFPNNFVYAGDFTHSLTNNRGIDGGYWVSTVGTYNYSYFLYLSASYYLNPGTQLNYKNVGRSVRCIAES